MLKFKKGSSGTLTTINAVNFKKGSNSSVALTDIVINGTHVWCKNPSFSSSHTTVSQADGNIIASIVISNNSNRNVSFTVSSVGALSKTVSIAGNSTGTCGLSFSSIPSTIMKWSIQWLDNVTTITTTLGGMAV